MTRAFVLVTALPPTYGHLDLIQFAGALDVSGITVLLNTQPDEPYARERYWALQAAVEKLGLKFDVVWQNEKVQQEPTGPDDQRFWDDWVRNLRRFGFKRGDIIVASEAYGVRLAKEALGRFMVYDRDRWVRFTKGMRTRNNYMEYWNDIIPEFRKYLVQKVTLFGAESTGKTTLTKRLADDHYYRYATKLFEWARPYLEMTGPDVTIQGMYDIWEGQHALQICSYENALKPLVIQDTDLWTTIGFWEDWKPKSVPDPIYQDAIDTQSDLYLITKSNIPFEHDALRYGGDERQTSDRYWIDFAEKYNLNYRVLESETVADRIHEAMQYIDELIVDEPLAYQRVGAEYRG